MDNGQWTIDNEVNFRLSTIVERKFLYNSQIFRRAAEENPQSLSIVKCQLSTLKLPAFRLLLHFYNISIKSIILSTATTIPISHRNIFEILEFTYLPITLFEDVR